MPIPSSRYKLLPLRGLKVNLDAGLADIMEGEMCYATDEDRYYQKENGILVATGGSNVSVIDGGDFNSGSSIAGASTTDLDGGDFGS